MPPSPREELRPCFSSEELAIPPQRPLDRSESERFLGFLFWDVAEVPQVPLGLNNTAAAVRYLLRLARRGVPKDLMKSGNNAIDQYWLDCDQEGGRPCVKHRQIRERTKRLAEAIWRDLLQQAEIKPATADQTRRFLRD